MKRLLVTSFLFSSIFVTTSFRREILIGWHNFVITNISFNNINTSYPHWWVLKPYNYMIDRTIIEILHEKERMSMGELSRVVAKRLGLKRPEIEKKMFISRLKQMTKKQPATIPYLGHSRYVIYPVLEKDSSLGIGNEFYYSLSKNAKILRRLGLAILWEDKGNEAKYQLLLLVFLLHDAPIEKVKVKSQSFKSEEEFNNFLMRIHISRRELKRVNIQYNILDAPADGIWLRGRLKPKPINIRYNNVDALSITTLYDRSDIKIFRIGPIGNLQEGNLEEGYYTYRLPGTSLNDILNHTQYVGSIPFSHIELTEEYIEKYLELLQQEELILPIVSNFIIHLGETRYEVNDKMLRDFLHQCWYIHEYSILRMR